MLGKVELGQIEERLYTALKASLNETIAALSLTEKEKRELSGSLAPRNKRSEEALALVRMIARMDKDGDPAEDGGEFIMSGADAVDTLNSLIDMARNTIGVEK